MQRRRRISLNAVRLFTIVARTGSLSATGVEIGVTPSAVSHQIRKLEEELGVRLFLRSNNAISLTEAGGRFRDEVAPAVALIERSADLLRRDENEVSVHASTSLAVRWLIPSLERFHEAHPDIRVRIETGFSIAADIRPTADIAIGYFRDGEGADGWDALVVDVSRPYVSPGLASKAKAAVNLYSLPAIQCTRDNWDWRLWCTRTGMTFEDIRFVHAFDTDDAALHACVAGLGMVLGSPLLTRQEILAGTLIELPGVQPAELGTYRFMRHSDRRAVRKFYTWLAKAISDFLKSESRV